MTVLHQSGLCSGIQRGLSAALGACVLIGEQRGHHFVVDAFIWRLGKQDSNRAIVDSGQAAVPAPA